MDQKIKQDRCIGTNIRAQRQKSGLTQEQVASKMQIKGIDMTRDYYAHIENGTYNIRTSHLIAFRQLFKCSFDDFFTDLEL